MYPSSSPNRVLLKELLRTSPPLCGYGPWFIPTDIAAPHMRGGDADCLRFTLLKTPIPKSTQALSQRRRAATVPAAPAREAVNGIARPLRVISTDREFVLSSRNSIRFEYLL